MTVDYSVLAERIQARLAVPDDRGCRLWLGARSNNGFGPGKGYGQIKARGMQLGVHVVIWTAANGLVPRGMVVRHTCDNPGCAELSHLQVGTHAENQHDKKVRGRAPKGEAIKNAKLTADVVRAIRCATEPQKVIAQRFGCSVTTVCTVRQRKVWGHVT